jgi:hypothetical protein
METLIENKTNHFEKSKYMNDDMMQQNFNNENLGCYKYEIVMVGTMPIKVKVT